MNNAAGDILPENYDRWPRSVQRQFIEQLYLLYFPERAHQAAAEIAEDPRGKMNPATSSDEVAS